MAKFSSFCASPQVRAKYGNKRVGTHASKREHYRAQELRLMERAGLISDLREQVPYVLIPAQYGECGKDFKGRTSRVLLERACSYIAFRLYRHGYWADHCRGHQGVPHQRVYHQAQAHASCAWHTH